MSRSGNVWDNAAMESFFSSLKSGASSDTTRAVSVLARRLLDALPCDQIGR
jgi:transposase InsO family protein